MSIDKDIGNAISGALRQHDDGFITRWVALVEVIGEDGNRALYTATSDELTPWDACGLLTYALYLEQKQATCGHEE